MNSKQIKDWIDFSYFGLTDRKTSTHPKRIARKTLNGNTYRLFRMDGILAGSVGWLEVVTDQSGSIIAATPVGRSDSMIQSVTQKYDKITN